MGSRENIIKLLNRFIDILNSKAIAPGLLQKILRAIELFDEKLAEDNIIWGSGLPNSEYVEDSDPMVQELKQLIMKYIERR